MADKDKKAAGRDARLAAALRENLKRRKAQERARASISREQAPAGSVPKKPDS